MLNDMLRLLNDGGIHSVTTLARRLNVSEGLVRLMTEELTRRGYLTMLGGGCATTCDHCSSSGACGAKAASSTQPPLLALTPKGRQLANS